MLAAICIFIDSFDKFAGLDIHIISACFSSVTTVVEQSSCPWLAPLVLFSSGASAGWNTVNFRCWFDVLPI